MLTVKTNYPSISIHHTNCSCSTFGMQQYANKYINTHLLFLLFQLRQFLFQLAHCSKLHCKYSNAKYTAKILFCVNVIQDHEYPGKISHKSERDCQCPVKYNRKVSQIFTSMDISILYKGSLLYERQHKDFEKTGL